jgi:hypothetical protein
MYVIRRVVSTPQVPLAHKSPLAVFVSTVFNAYDDIHRKLNDRLCELAARDRITKSAANVLGQKHGATRRILLRRGKPHNPAKATDTSLVDYARWV